MLHTPFYDPLKSYQENFKDGPFGDFSDRKVFVNAAAPKHDFLGQKVFAPFGIPAGPLVNGRFVKAAWDKGFDIAVYKTVRSRKYPCNAWPNVLPINLEADLSMAIVKKGVIVKDDYAEPLSITNSFGVPSFDPDFWQNDMADALSKAQTGQVLVGSFQGTLSGNSREYVKDFATAARLVKETGVKILEANLSCPNEGSSHLLCFDIKRTREVVEAIKEEIGQTPLVIKISYFEDHKLLEELVKETGKLVSGIAAINTIATAIYNKEGSQAIAGEGRLYSGVGGEGVRWAGLETVAKLNEFKKTLDLGYSIIGIGGVMNPAHYADYINAGADLVMSATGAMWNPYLAQEIKKNIN